MKILLLEDVYKLGRAGDVKKVANGYGRNYLIPQGLAVLAIPGALKQVEHIRTKAATRRAVLNEEMSGLAEQLEDLVLTFAMKAGETEKLYGSVTTQMIADALKEEVGVEIDRRQIDAQPIRMLGEHKVNIRLTVDLIPVITVVVYREGETAEAVLEAEEITVPELEDETEISEPVTGMEAVGESAVEVETDEDPAAEAVLEAEEIAVPELEDEAEISEPVTEMEAEGESAGVVEPDEESADELDAEDETVAETAEED